MNWSTCCRFIISFILTVVLLGCQSASYYAQAIWGQVQIMSAKQPVAELIEDPGTLQAVKEKLAYVLAVRDFARKELLLPVGGAYLDYADIHRPFVVWNVFAAPELSLEPKTWCYPMVGCASYRGYFDRGAAESYASALGQDGYDVFVSGVLAYSTLGWFNDPVLSTFLQLDNARLSALIFHELAHRVLYVADDTDFNESFATAVEEEGMRRWAAASQTSEIFAVHERRQKMRDTFIGLVSRRRNELRAVYASDLSPERKKIEKATVFGALLSDFELEKQRDPEMAGYKEWFASGLNNAALVPLAAYHDLSPAFQRILNRSDGNWAAFYEECRRLSCLAPAERKERLQRLMLPQPH
jgi:predicted aminopeptidase